MVILELVSKSSDSIVARVVGTEHELSAGPDTVWGIPGTRTAPVRPGFPTSLWSRAQEGALKLHHQRDVLAVGYSIEI